VRRGFSTGKMIRQAWQRKTKIGVLPVVDEQEGTKREEEHRLPVSPFEKWRGRSSVELAPPGSIQKNAKDGNPAENRSSASCPTCWPVGARSKGEGELCQKKPMSGYQQGKQWPGESHILKKTRYLFGDVMRRRLEKGM